MWWLWYRYFRKGALEKALYVEKKTPYGKKLWKTIYEVIKDDYFDESKLKNLKEFLMKFNTEYNVTQFIPHKVRGNIWQVGI